MDTPQGSTDTELVQPWEKGEAPESVATAEQSLFDLLGSDPDFADEVGEEQDEDPTNESEPLPDDVEEGDDGEGDDVEEDDDAGDEDDEDQDVGEEDEDDDLTDDEDNEEEIYLVTVEGEDIEVTFDELMNGYSRTEYLTRTRQRESAAHKAAMTDVQTAGSEYAEKLTMMDEALAQLNPAEPDWEQVQRDNPAQFGALFSAHQNREKVAQAVRAEQALELEKAQGVLAEDNDVYMSEQMDLLTHSVPAWKKDEKAMGREINEISAFAQKELGFTEAELAGIVDHRMILTLRAAMRGKEMESGGKKKLRNKGKQQKRAMQPKGRSRKATNAKGKGKKRIAKHAERVARTGTQQDAAALFNAMLDDGADL